MFAAVRAASRPEAVPPVAREVGKKSVEVELAATVVLVVAETLFISADEDVVVVAVEAKESAPPVVPSEGG